MPRIASGKDQAPGRCENMTRLKARQQVANLITAIKITHMTQDHNDHDIATAAHLNNVFEAYSLHQ